MPITKRLFSEMLLSAADLWRANTDVLSDIDSRFGDGDHGVTIKKIANTLSDAVAAWDDASIKEFIETLSGGIMAVGGGSAGPLYGTLVEGLATPLGKEADIDGPLLCKMFQGSLSAMQAITKARAGDKTMMDALIPAVEAATSAGDALQDILAAAAQAAAQGAEATKGYVSKFGRARNYGEQTLGTPDAGAVSTALFFQGLQDGFVRHRA